MKESILVPACQCPNCHSLTLPYAVTMGADGLKKVYYQCNADLGGHRCGTQFELGHPKAEMPYPPLRRVEVEVSERPGLYENKYLPREASGYFQRSS